jgi:hypothetical protein
MERISPLIFRDLRKFYLQASLDPGPYRLSGIFLPANASCTLPSYAC